MINGSVWSVSTFASEDQSDDFAGEDWFEIDPEPRLLLSLDGKVISSNQAARDALAGGALSVDRNGTLHFGSAESDQAFAIGLCKTSADRNDHCPLVLRGRDGSWMAGTLHRTTNPARVILALHVDRGPSEAAMGALAHAFQLTRSEASVLGALVGGKCPKVAAGDLDISEHTVRSHLRSIYAKLGVKGLTDALRRTSSLTGGNCRHS